MINSYPFRLHSLGLGLSYSTTLNKLTELGQDHDETVKNWSKAVQLDQHKFSTEIELQLVSPIDIPIVKTPCEGKTFTSAREKFTFNT